MNIQIIDYLYDDDEAYYDWQGRQMRQSVHGRAYTRLRKAMEQAQKEKIAVDDIIAYVKHFLKSNGITTAENPILAPSMTKYLTMKQEYNLNDERDTAWTSRINYSAIKQEYHLKDERDIVWMKFTSDGYLGAVATSNDINFKIPPTSDEYDDKERDAYTGKNDWKWNSAGILIHKLGKTWDTSFVLLFPLSDLPRKYTRHDVEKAIGNYLIKLNVPIIDYYSHMY